MYDLALLCPGKQFPYASSYLSPKALDSIAEHFGTPQNVSEPVREELAAFRANSFRLLLSIFPCTLDSIHIMDISLSMSKSCNFSDSPCPIKAWRQTRFCRRLIVRESLPDHQGSSLSRRRAFKGQLSSYDSLLLEDFLPCFQADSCLLPHLLLSDPL